MLTSLGNALNKLDALSAPLNRLDRDDQRRNIELLRDGIAELLSRAEAAEAKLAECRTAVSRYEAATFAVRNNPKMLLSDPSSLVHCAAGMAELESARTALFAVLAQPKPEGVWDESYEIWQDGMCVAGSDDESDALHYAMMYGRDGPVKMFRLLTMTRSELDSK